MLSGCCLVASNPEQDHELVRPDIEYEEVPERDPVALTQAVLALAARPQRRIELARRGAERLRARADVHHVVERKLAALGLL